MVVSRFSLMERSAIWLRIADAFAGLLARRRSTALDTFSSEEELMVRFAPSASACLATAKPIPEDPPINRMFLFASLLTVAIFLGLKNCQRSRNSKSDECTYGYVNISVALPLVFIAFNLNIDSCLAVFFVRDFSRVY